MTTFSWEQYVQLSEKLISNLPYFGEINEAVERSAVSRAYYGAFRIAVDFAKDNWGYEEPETNAHISIIKLFKSHSKCDDKYTKIASSLSMLRRWRNECDYESPFQSIGNSKYCADNAINKAKRIIEILTQP